MQLTTAILHKIAKGKAVPANVASIVTAYNQYGVVFGLDQPHRLAHYIAQLGHESGGFKFDREIASGAAYEGRRDLGNTKRGDGKRYKGRSPVQITGRANYRSFTAWARKFTEDAPDFEASPDLVNTDPWEGLGPIWYWDEGNPDPKGRSLNYYADRNDIEMITRRINGGLNGYADRLSYYDRIALVLLGYPVNGLHAFQEDAKKRGDYPALIDGQSGPQTRAALHKALVALTDTADRSDEIKAAPVVSKEPVAVPIKELEKPWYQSPEVLGPVAAPVLPALAGFDWRVMLAAILIGAALAVFLIVRRDRMKSRQAERVAEIEGET